MAPATPPAAAAMAPGAPGFAPPPVRHRHSSSSGGEVHSPRIADIQPFELSFFDLAMERSIGRGSFGKGKRQGMHHAPAMLMRPQLQVSRCSMGACMTAVSHMPRCRRLAKSKPEIRCCPPLASAVYLASWHETLVAVSCC